MISEKKKIVNEEEFLRVLVIYKCLGSLNRLKRSVKDHLRFFQYSDCVDVVYWNVANGLGRFLKEYDFDLIIFHTTLLSSRYGDSVIHEYWSNGLEWTLQSSAIKIALPQDERFYCVELVSFLEKMEVDIVYSVFASDEVKINQIYGNESTSLFRFEQCYTGYVDDSLVNNYNVKSWCDREYDVVYRAKRLPLWVGRHGQLKAKIHDFIVSFRKGCKQLRINSSVDTRDIITGTKWLDFISNSKYIVGCEAGGTALDRYGDLSNYIKKIEKNCSIGSVEKIEEIEKKFGSGWDSYDFRTLGPRNFEAAITMTCQLLVEGEYAGVMKPNIHYIPIKKDLSNLHSVLESLSDDEGRKVAKRAHLDLVKNGNSYTYSSFACRVLKDVQNERIKKKIVSSKVETSSFFRLRLLSFLIDNSFGVSQLPNLVYLKVLSIGKDLFCVRTF